MANSRVCSIPDCGKAAKALGWCQGHYKRHRKYGDPLAGATPHGEPLKWLSEHMSCDIEECVMWPFGRGGDGYGRVYDAGSMRLAHRVMCERVHGPSPSDIHEVAHTCGKGRSGCVNAAHLRWATPSENQSDRIDHGTHSRGDRNAMAKLTEDDVIAIRRRATTERQVDLAAAFGVGQTTISAIVTGQNWNWL